MARLRTLLLGVAMLVTSAGVALAPAGAAYAVDDFTAFNRCQTGATAQLTNGLAAAGNALTTFTPPAFMLNNDAFRITASGSITVDLWRTSKSVGGDPVPAGAGFPIPGARKYMLIARVNKGWFMTATGAIYPAGRWFPVGFDSGCLKYSRQSPVTPADPSAFLTFSYNDDNIADNGGAGNVLVRQWYCTIC
ncbi:hypothetical protein Rhe02_03180 [Rhizocola hellebori]|uniref:Uncharacterized protein n=1 Tax=Rhizocola hellebori TaxID=1392758 RepID=A0A8J3Q263_9ACTN|nr:hypothetical protein [Rhizocola hellebori]GIH02251.1 hypothetical protein Rhe02_03180 [Rhizocola hellebori]